MKWKIFFLNTVGHWVKGTKTESSGPYHLKFHKYNVRFHPCISHNKLKYAKSALSYTINPEKVVLENIKYLFIYSCMCKFFYTAEIVGERIESIFKNDI